MFVRDSVTALRAAVPGLHVRPPDRKLFDSNIRQGWCIHIIHK